MIDTLRTLIAFHSVSSDQKAVGALLDYVEDRLAPAGLVVERLEFDGIKSLYASTTGSHHSKVMLQGHIDVVPGGDAFGQDGNKITGRGCYDMLFAAASFLHLIDTLDNVKDYDISILLTGDEELGGENGVGTVAKQGYTSDVCILPDAGDDLGTLSVGAKGVFHVRLKIRGIAHHGSRPWEGDGAGNKTMAFLDELSTAFDPSSHDNSTFVVSQLQAGSGALNQAPAEATVGIDIRYRDQADYTRIRALFDDLCHKYRVEILDEEVGRSFALDHEAPIVKRFVDIYAATIGKPIEFTRAYGSSDARFLDEISIPVIMFRPDGGGAHGDDEWLSASSWETFHRVLEHYVVSVARA